MDRYLVIVGAGIEQAEAYREAKKLGLLTMGTDLNPSAPCFELADIAVKASTRSPSDTLHAVLESGFASRVVGVMTIANDVPETVATVSDHLQLSGLSTDAAEILGNKKRMRSHLESIGVGMPKGWIMQDRPQILKAMVESQRQEFILKPLDGRGARGVMRFSRHEIGKLDLGQVTKESDHSEFALEEFVQGEQYSVEAAVIDGIARTVGISLRNYGRNSDYYPFVIEDGGDINHHPPSGLLRGSDDILSKVAVSLDMSYGTLKADLVVDEEGSVLVIEVAGRLSGGWFASHQIPAATGVNLVRFAIQSAIGERVAAEEVTPKFSRAVSTRYLFPPPGKIKSLSGLPEALSSPGIIHGGTFRGVGDYQPEVQKHSDRFGFLIAEAETLDAAKTRVQDAMKAVRVETS